jgi:sugar O-acyltransferase (sialic acid O-acetyltransferase NeuD family)
VVPFEKLTQFYPQKHYAVYVAIVYTQLNRLRTRLYLKAKQWGYSLASYVSSRAFIWPNVQLGEHNFIFENNVVQPFVALGDNNILWSGNHIGHHSVIKNNCFIASHVVISGHCTVGDNCFFGVNSTLANELNISDDCVIGAGSLIMRHMLEGSVYKGHASSPAERNSFQVFRVKAEPAHEVA